MSLPMTMEQFKEALPPQMQKGVNQELLNTINSTLKDPEAMEMYKENLLSYTYVLKEGKFKMQQYLNAVRYVGFKVAGLLNIDAYIKTFPDKYQDFLARKVADKDIASYVTAYNKSKLVNLIYEQALIPIHIVNAPLLQKAINVQATLMLTAKSEKVRSDAAACLIRELRDPEVKTSIKLNVAVQDNNLIQELNDRTMALAVMQQKMIEQGIFTSLEIAHQPLLIDSGECRDAV